ncbi:hypothetical protein [Litoribaculum gwangyangense]|uniref:Uncharacterized protein n=1 Tax=Litoribaculum gwangyangense TaxID=1130722 RepID=A0ABP9CBD5_9FLAO
MANNDVTLQFINQIVADVKLKKNKVLEGITGDLICAQLDKNNNILQRQIVKNPLIKNIEYIDDSKSFNNKQIELDSTQIAIRLQLEPNTKYISIYNFNTKKNKTKALITTAID